MRCALTGMGAVLLLLLGAAGAAAAAATTGERPRPVQGGEKTVWIGSAPVKSGADTLCLLGDDGDARGDFQSGYPPQPDWDGWYGADLTQPDSSLWHMDTYFAQNLDPGIVPNHAWWCGEDLPSCYANDPDGGYPNKAEEMLDWWGEVPAPLSATTARLTAVLNHDCEPGYDYLYLEGEIGGDMQTLATYNGLQDGVPVDVAGVFATGDYVPHPDTGNPSVHLRFFFVSDGGWSDEDCAWPTHGAAQIDLIRVFFDQGGGEVQVGPTETCEPGDPVTWRVSFPQGVGDFAHIWPELDDLDPCHQNRTPQAAFIDDGLVVPGTGGSFCTTWCYGPGGYTVNLDGGLRGPGHPLRNEIWSPVLAWPDPGAGYDGALLEYTVYGHLPLMACNDQFYVWHVRSTADGTPGGPAPDTGWTEWRDRDFVYYGGPDYQRDHRDVSDLLLPGRTHVQVALGVFQVGWIWCWWSDPTPAPYFDDVRVCVFRQGGPVITAAEAYLAQDGFPESGTLACADPCAMHVRFDMASDISPPAVPGLQPGDSIVADVKAVRAGTALAGPPELVYRLRRNAIFDACRSAGLPDLGVVPGDSVRDPLGRVVADRWWFDLPDSGFLLPGDVLHYYLRAADTGGGTTTLPGDTAGFSVFPAGIGEPTAHFPEPFVVRALPGIRQLDTCAQPDVLCWLDGGAELQAEWRHALWELGRMEGDAYDLYVTNAPSAGLGNGLGGRATPMQVAGYDVVLYGSGAQAEFTLGDGTQEHDPGDDVGLLDAWLRDGDRCLLLSGDHLVSDLVAAGGAAQAFLDDWIRVELVDDDHAAILGATNLAVRAAPETGNPVFAHAGQWGVDAWCEPVVQSCDLVTATGTPGRLAGWLTPDCAPAGEAYAAAVQTVNAGFGANVIYLPYDLGRVVQDVTCGGDPVEDRYAERVDLLRDVLGACGLPPGAVDMTVGVPEVAGLAVRCRPNPFNPRVRIEYHTTLLGYLSVSVYNLKGEKVKVLRQEVVPAGPGFVVWDGTDESGAAVASGVYFCRTRSSGKEDVQKLLLVR